MSSYRCFGRWDYWVIFTPVTNGRLARKLFERQCPKEVRVRHSHYSRSAARRSKGRPGTFTLKLIRPRWEQLERRRMLYERNGWPRHGMPWKHWD